MGNKEDMLVEAFIKELFTSGHGGIVVDRLVLTTSSGQDVGGWGRDAVKRRLIKLVGELER